MNEALQVEGLTKHFRVKRKLPGLGGSLRALWRPSYEDKKAVDGIDLRVERGETVAFLGPNGAGKSTTIKMLTGILHPTSGQAHVLGYDPWRQRTALAYRIGAVFGQKSQLWYHLPPSDSFELMSRIYELDRAVYRQRRDLLIERFELGRYIDTPVRRLSLGERMRCEIAIAFLHRPELLFLDEPTIGLDAIVKQRIRELIAELNREEGTTVFLTSHDPGDIERLCRRAIVIDHGRVIVDEPVERLRRSVLSYKRVVVRLAEEATELAALPGVETHREAPRVLRLMVDTAAVGMTEVLSELMARYRIEDMTMEDPPMDDVIRAIYQGNSGLREEGDA